MLIFMTALINASSALSTVDDALIERIAEGDSEAFRTLYETVSGNVYGFALSITKNTHDAEDVLHDTFLTVHSSASAYKPMGKPMAWIFTIARNHALMRMRTKTTVDIDSMQLEDASALSGIESAENRMLVETLMNELDSDERRIVMLHAVSGLKNREIADILEMPLGTVLSKYRRAIIKLRTKAEKEGLSL